MSFALLRRFQLSRVRFLLTTTPAATSACGSFQLELLPSIIISLDASPISEWERLDTEPRHRSRSRSGVVNAGYAVDDDDEDKDDDEDEDRSLDLLIRFVQNIFKKVSRRARKAVRSVLPVPISSQLVGFSVNGVIILTFMWVLKAFLEVVCTLGSVVFISILLIRGTWTGIAYLQESRNYRPDELDDEHRTWTGSQPAT
ncbi:protein SHORT HYPOCOTYL IN WHITE LIGHT 1-like isoform X2 [Coffea eugenioides]|uniref:protein SHORT HYPOCOTYL IN WHITE LIGHT 1-like isoform X2 n=1 Tax=Coffea eugenioides TaxID=49369 RepID=UPI000F610DAA|nr:protein SHORT HYPOCOTYL IN WHITE LIGHT 1-like isoform X2 [Coffea eugenioides]